jgi:hypothetical protein
MSPTVVGLAITAAILHAAWNAFLRTGADRLWTLAVMSLSGTMVAIPLAVIYPLPAGSAWFYVVASAGLQGIGAAIGSLLLFPLASFDLLDVASASEIFRFIGWATVMGGGRIVVRDLVLGGRLASPAIGSVGSAHHCRNSLWTCLRPYARGPIAIFRRGDRRGVAAHRRLLGHRRFRQAPILDEVSRLGESRPSLALRGPRQGCLPASSLNQKRGG